MSPDTKQKQEKRKTETVIRETGVSTQKACQSFQEILLYSSYNKDVSSAQ